MSAMRKSAAVLLAVAAAATGVRVAGQAAAPEPAPPRGHPAPTRLYPEPRLYLLLRLRGDRVDVRYRPGSLDRSANLQTRLERSARMFEKWSGEEPFELFAYALGREEWERAGFDLPYGIPVRIGRNGLAAPAVGDDGTVRLWSSLLDGRLPNVRGLPLVGTPQQAATLMVADVLVQLHACEVFVDRFGLESPGDPWVRGLMTHVVSRSLTERLEPHRGAELDAMYRLLARHREPRSLAGSDYGAELSLTDWLWFQAQLHSGAGTIVEKAGKGAVKAMRKLERKGRLREEVLFRRYDALEEWYRRSFSAVSLRTES